MKIDDLWAVYDQALEVPNTVGNIAFFALLIGGLVFGLVSAYREKASFGGYAGHVIVSGFVGFVAAVAIAIISLMVFTIDDRNDLVESIQERAMDEYKVELPEDAVRDTVLRGGSENESYQMNKFISKVDGETMMVYLDFDADNKTLTIATDSPDVERKTNLNVLTEG